MMRKTGSVSPFFSVSFPLLRLFLSCALLISRTPVIDWSFGGRSEVVRTTSDGGDVTRRRFFAGNGIGIFDREPDRRPSRRNNSIGSSGASRPRPAFPREIYWKHCEKRIRSLAVIEIFKLIVEMRSLKLAVGESRFLDAFQSGRWHNRPASYDHVSRNDRSLNHLETFPFLLRTWRKQFRAACNK